MPQATPAVYVKLLLTVFFWSGVRITVRVAVHEVSPFAVANWRFFVTVLALAFLLYLYEGRPAGIGANCSSWRRSGSPVSSFCYNVLSSTG